MIAFYRPAQWLMIKQRVVSIYLNNPVLCKQIQNYVNIHRCNSMQIITNAGC